MHAVAVPTRDELGSPTHDISRRKLTPQSLDIPLTKIPPYSLEQQPPKRVHAVAVPARDKLGSPTHDLVLQNALNLLADLHHVLLGSLVVQ